ncbi:MAG: recombination protein RecR [Gammaproteobacteria bacterium]|nr:recombination protein RecR [Gammaproteobacteria bacterium]
MRFPPRLEQLLNTLRRLPGVGPKTAQRMAFHLLERDREGAAALASALQGALQHIGHCGRCRMLAEGEVCALCSMPGRDHALVCVVESPADVGAVEESGSYRGLYFVLHGRLSPLDGVGPAELGLDSLAARLRGGGVREVILATSATVEGEATAAYVATMARDNGLRATRIAHGVPIGGEIEYVDGTTLARAIAGRVVVDTDGEPGH